MGYILKINQRDNVVVALQDLAQGTVITVDNQRITLLTSIPRAHKIALSDLAVNQKVFKYGASIGHVTQAIHAGEAVNDNNLASALESISAYQYQPDFCNISQQLSKQEVQIYRRKNGAVAIRNELWIIPTVGCVNGIAQQLKKQLLMQCDLSAIDGVHIIEHQYGCSQLGLDHLNTRTILQDMLHHPNAGAVLVLGLGCENNQVSDFKHNLKSYDKQRVRFMVCQQQRDEITTGVALLTELVTQMRTDRRQRGHIGELTFGLECGGSDGFSGITANPLLGLFSDYVIHHGGSTILTEVPEMFGAEHLLMSRCANEAVFNQTVTMINHFKQYFIDHQQAIYENPSPGNRAGGISTLEEKSLGCTQKAGQTPIVDVLPYGARRVKPGLNLLSAPGNDAVATTALVASGCHMVLFTTGRGTPFGGPVPTLKIATNSELAQYKTHWIDFNAGELIEGTSMTELLVHFIELVVQVINGQLTCNERNDICEIAIFKTGVTL